MAAIASPATFDVAICGAGPVGMALAALLVQGGMPAARIALLDARALDQASADPRAIALSYGSSQILRQLGAWPLAASSIGEIHVSRRGHFGRTLITAAEQAVPALGYVTRYGVLVEALAAQCKGAGIRMLRPERVEAVTEDADQVTLRLAAGSSISTKVMVQAEGGLFHQQAGKARSHDYAQSAIVAQVRVSAPLLQRAFERFTDEGPLALLPLPAASVTTASSSAASTMQAGQQPSGTEHYALVWCLRTASAEAMLALPESDFLAALQEAFGERVGRFLQVSARHSYALGLNADAAATARTVAIGNAAQTLHPVAGQGLNLGLRDATVLARLLCEPVTPVPALLQRFLAQRHGDRNLTIRMTDLMARIFASAPQGTVSQSVLGLGLGLVDTIDPLRRALAAQMMFGRR
jgi:2-octaprenyl-6-methoxyphenol hydroxylase